MQVLSLKPSDVYEDTSGDKSYTHTQSVAATTWTVIHNMGRIPSIVVINGVNGNSVIGRISHIDNNTAVIHLKPAMAGTAHCT
jgi:hypothetical protein